MKVLFPTLFSVIGISATAVNAASVPNNGARDANKGFASTFNLTYGGGYLSVTPINFYPIYYGTWSQSQIDITNKFLNSLCQSPYWGIMQEYKDANGKYISGPCGVAKQFTDPGVVGESVGVGRYLYQQIYVKKTIPRDLDGMILFMTDGVMKTDSHVCESVCGYHLSQSVLGPHEIPFTVTGRCKNVESCGSINKNSSPNGDIHLDNMLSFLAHEICEGASNMDLKTGWLDKGRNPGENGDLCNFNFGSTSNIQTAPEGYKYNQVWDGKKYLIQQMVGIKTQQCLSSAPYIPQPAYTYIPNLVTSTTKTATATTTTKTATGSPITKVSCTGMPVDYVFCLSDKQFSRCTASGTSTGYCSTGTCHSGVQTKGTPKGCYV